jgi:hypothetical protein
MIVYAAVTTATVIRLIGSWLTSNLGRFPFIVSLDFQRSLCRLPVRADVQDLALENPRSNLPLHAQKPPLG